MTKANKAVKRKLRRFLAKWMRPLGLLWWEVDVYYHTDPKDIRKKFRTRKGAMSCGITYADWRYGYANVHFNVPAFVGMKDVEIEKIVIHELVHVLVNEMREGEMHHEERVVSNLAQAFIWTREGM